MEKIGASIETNGFYGTIVAQKSTGYVLAGNHRLLAAKAAGAKTLDVAWVDVDDDRALRIMLVDNKSSDDASNDEAALGALLEELSATELQLDGTGFDALLPEDEPELTSIAVMAPPKMAWVLVGIPVVRFSDVQELVDQLSAVEGSIVQTTVNDG